MYKDNRDDVVLNAHNTYNAYVGLNAHNSYNAYVGLNAHDHDFLMAMNNFECMSHSLHSTHSLIITSSYGITIHCISRTWSFAIACSLTVLR